MQRPPGPTIRTIEPRRESEPPAELECQFVMRLPPEPAKALRETLRSGTMNVKDRLGIKLENDMRYGEVRFDHWLMHAKVVDMPTIIESLKTIDNKSFYKTADICQMLICKEDDDQTTTDEESPSKTKKKDPNKVDKKFLWPHGITPSLKNIRRRRFRKTLKKKVPYVEAPEIEKEVKRLLRVDNDAVNVKWEVINEDDEKIKHGLVKEEMGGSTTGKDGDTSLETSNQLSGGFAEHDIFGEPVSDSEEEEDNTNINIMELEEENSRLSAEDSRMSDSTVATSLQDPLDSRPLVTQFSKEMFSSRGSYERPAKPPSSSMKHEPEIVESNYNMKAEPLAIDFEIKNEASEGDEYHAGQLSKSAIRARLETLQQQLADLRSKRQQQEMEILNIENYALRQRFQEILDSLLNEQLQKEQEYQELSTLLQLP